MHGAPRWLIVSALSLNEHTVPQLLVGEERVELLGSVINERAGKTEFLTASLTPYMEVRCGN